MTFTIIFFIVLIGIILKLLHILYYEYETLYYRIKNYIYGCSYAGIPTHSQYLKIILGNLNNYDNMKEYTFIDFGCGNGKILTKYNDKFEHLIGIELDKNIVKKAKQNTNHYNNVTIINKNMIDFKFDGTNTVFFLYEPLWNIKSKQYSMNVYNKVFNNLYKTFNNNKSGKLYIVYLTGIFSKDLNEKFFKKYKLCVKNKYKLAYYPYRLLYMLEFNK